MGPYFVITTVLTPATSTDLTTLLNVKGDLSLSGSVPEDNIFLGRVIKQVTASAQNYCNRVFAQQTYQDVVTRERRTSTTFTQSRAGEYITANGPLVSVTSVTENTTLLTLGTDYEVGLSNSTIYRLDSNGNRCAWGDWPLTIVYVAGWTLPPLTTPTPLLPPDIEDAVIRMIKAKWFARDRDPTLKSQEIAGVGREDYWIAGPGGSGDFPPDIADILNNYRINTVA